MTAIGPVDILCRDAAGGSVAVEIKRRGDIDGVEQLTRYLELMNRDPHLAPVTGVFAAQEIKPQARTLATDRGIRCVTLDYDALKRHRRQRARASSEAPFPLTAQQRPYAAGAAHGPASVPSPLPGRRGRQRRATSSSRRAASA